MDLNYLFRKLKYKLFQSTAQIDRNTAMIQRLSNDLNNKEQAISIEQAAVDLTVLTKGPLPPPSSRNKEGAAGRNKVMRGPLPQWWANLDQASKDLDKTIFRDLSPTPKP